MYKRKSWRHIRAILTSIKKGSAINTACQSAGVAVSTFWNWRKEEPRLDMIVKSLYDSRIAIVEDALYKGALDGNVTSQIFFLKNRAVDRWRDRTEHEHSGEVKGGSHTTIIFKDATPEEIDNENRLYAYQGNEGIDGEEKV